MNYILDYLNDLLDSKKTELVFPSFQNVQTEDPLSKLIKWLNTERGNGIKIKSDEDILIEDFLPKENNKIIQLNLDSRESTKQKETSIFKTNKRNPDFPTEKHKSILKELKRVTVYAVVNGSNEIILASPREGTNNNSLQWFYNQYYNWFIWKEDEGPITVGLFFSNKEDAESYLHEICLKDPHGAQNSGLSVKSTGLDTFYYLNRTSNPKIQVRMISDLQELDLLLNNNIKDSKSFINPKQKYGKNWFKGTPIYIMRVQDINREKETIGKKLVFFNRDDIEKTLQLYKNKNLNIEIYNLENYLLDIEKLSVKDIEKIKFFPPYQSYEKTNEDGENTIAENLKEKDMKKIFTEKVRSIQRFCRGLVWLVTSDTLPSEENSW